MKILYVGDVHGQFEELYKLLKTIDADIVCCVGDFGYWPNMRNYTIGVLKSYDNPIYWCDGNHEDFESLNKIWTDRVPTPILDNVFYMPRGSHITVEGKNILFMGGAESHDKMRRTPGYDWFPEEIISRADIDALPNIEVDTVVSHTIPTYFKVGALASLDRGNDPSRPALNLVFKKYKPRKWYAGHWHEYTIGDYEGCSWKALNTLPYNGEPKGYGINHWLEEI